MTAYLDHAAGVVRPHRPPRTKAAIVATAAVLALWLGLRAPAVSPVAGTATQSQAPTTTDQAVDQTGDQTVDQNVGPDLGLRGGTGDRRDGGRRDGGRP